MLTSEEWLDEKISCEYCEKEVKVRDMEDWLKLSDVSRDMTSNPLYFCGYPCLKAWVNESEAMNLAREEQQIKDRQWQEQEKRKGD